MHAFRTLLGSLLFLLALSAQAQWQWLDLSGRKVFSDQPPPANIPPKNILKQPNRPANTAVAVEPAQAAAPASASATPKAAVPRLDEEDKYLTERKKKQDALAQEKVKEEAQRIAQIRAANCEKARSSLAVIDSGVRVSITNAKGEREILDDAARAEEQRKNRIVMEANCK